MDHLRRLGISERELASAVTRATEAADLLEAWEGCASPPPVLSTRQAAAYLRDVERLVRRGALVDVQTVLRAIIEALECEGLRPLRMPSLWDSLSLLSNDLDRWIRLAVDRCGLSADEPEGSAP